MKGNRVNRAEVNTKRSVSVWHQNAGAVWVSTELTSLAPDLTQVKAKNVSTQVCYQCQTWSLNILTHEKAKNMTGQTDDIRNR